MICALIEPGRTLSVPQKSVLQMRTALSADAEANEGGARPMITMPIFNQSWQPTTVSTATVVVRAIGFDLRDVCLLAATRNARTATKKHHAAAMKATVWGPQPWSPPVT